MEYQPNQFGQQTFSEPQKLPNATAVLILGIFSIVGCGCFGGTGLISSIIALVLAQKDMRLYHANPQAYTTSSYSNLNSGRICAIIGLVISAVYTIFIIVMIIKVGFAAFTDIPNRF